MVHKGSKWLCRHLKSTTIHWTSFKKYKYVVVSRAPVWQHVRPFLLLIFESYLHSVSWRWLHVFWLSSAVQRHAVQSSYVQNRLPVTVHSISIFQNPEYLYKSQLKLLWTAVIIGWCLWGVKSHCYPLAPTTSIQKNGTHFTSKAVNTKWLIFSPGWDLKVKNKKATIF